jgi:hypothetical protein
MDFDSNVPCGGCGHKVFRAKYDKDGNPAGIECLTNGCEMIFARVGEPARDDSEDQVGWSADFSGMHGDDEVMMKAVSVPGLVIEEK